MSEHEGYPEKCCPPSVASACRPVGDGAKLARPALCALARRPRRIAPASPSAIANRHSSRARLARGSSVSHDRRTAARDACNPRALGFSRTKCPYLCDVRRKARRVVFQPGRRQRAGGCDCTCVVSLTVFSRANALRKPGRLESLRQRANASRSVVCVAEVPISPHWRSVFLATWHAGIFPNRTVLLVYNGRTRSNHSRGDSSSAVATSARRSGACA